jgi:hypothetical protein
MTDARFPERWLNDLRLHEATDSQFRLFTLANAWAVSNRTDGVISSRHLSLIPRATTTDAAALVALGLWQSTSTGWAIVDFLRVQTSRSQLEGLEARMANDRERSKRHYDKRNKRETSREETGGTSRENNVRSSRENKGQDRTGHSFDGDKNFETENRNEKPRLAAVPADPKNAFHDPALGVPEPWSDEEFARNRAVNQGFDQ